MPFIRVKSARPGDPLHEFHVSAAEYEANKSLYRRVEKGVADEPHAPTYVTPKKRTK